MAIMTNLRILSKSQSKCLSFSFDEVACGNTTFTTVSKPNMYWCEKSFTSAPQREDGIYLNTCSDGHIYHSSLYLVGQRCKEAYEIGTKTTYECDICGTSYDTNPGSCTKMTYNCSKCGASYDVKPSRCTADK